MLVKTFIVTVWMLAGVPSLLAGSQTVSGIVRSADGGALDHATVELILLMDNFERASQMLAGKIESAPAAATRTDENGRFSLEAPLTGVWRLVVRAETFVPMQVSPLPLTRDTELAAVTLQPDVGIRIRAAEAESPPSPPEHGGKRAVAGVWVYATSAERSFWRERAADGWRPGERLGLTDENGFLRLPRAAGEELEVSAFRPGTVLEARMRATAEVALELPVAGVERQVVVGDEEGRAEPRVLIAFSEFAWPAGKTDDRGRLQLRGPFSDPLLLHLATADGRSARVTFEPQKSGTTQVPRLILPRPRRVEGRLLAAPSRQPLAGALIWPGHDPGAFVLTDAAGRYEVVSPAQDRFWLQAEAAGFLPRASAVQPVDIRARRAPTLVLEPAAAIRGQVIDADGAALLGVELAIVPKAPTRRPRALLSDRALARGISDRAGRFELGRLRREGTYLLTAAKAGFRTAEVEVRTPADGTLRLTLDAARSAHGRVVGPDEQPIAEAAVRVVASSDGAPAPRLRSSRIFSFQDPFAARTDTTGRFELAQIAGPRVDIEVQREGYSSMTVRGVEVLAGAGPVDLGTLVLQPGAAIEGRVTDPEGEPILAAGVWVTADEGRPLRLAARGLEELEPHARTAASGRFRIDDLRVGERVRILVDAAGYLPFSVMGVEAPSVEPIRVVLEPAARVAGRVVEEGGTPVAGARIVLVERDDTVGVVGPRKHNRSTATSDERGGFALDRVAAGRVRVEAQAQGFQPPEPIALEIRSGQKVEGLLFQLARGAVLAGRVTNLEGEPVEGARLTLEQASNISDAEGVFRLEGIPPGARELLVRHSEYNWLEHQIEIEPGVNHLDLALAGGWPVRGQTVADSGESLAGVRIELRRIAAPDPRRYQAVSDAAGRFAVPRVADGTYLAEVDREGYVAAGVPATFEVDRAAVEGLEIQLERSVAIRGRIVGLDFEELTQVRVKAVNERGERRGTVDHEGTYEIADLRAGEWRLVARLEGGRRQAEATVFVERGARQAHRDLEFRGGLTLSGNVTHGGEPLAATRVTLSGYDVAAERSLWTDTKGGFSIEDLEPGRFRLRLANPSERLTYNQDLELLADRDLVIDIPTARVSGTVISATDRQPLANALVLLQQDLGDSPRRGSLTTLGTDAEGRFTVERLTAGRYRLTVRLDGYSTSQRLLEVEAGVAIDGLELLLPPTVGLDLVIRLASGRATPHAAFNVFDAAGTVVLSETRVLAPDGSVHFATIPDGDWELLVSAPGGVPTRTNVSVPGDPVEVVLGDASRLRVRVPVLMASNLNATLTLADRSGRFFEGVAATGALQRRWTLTAGTASIDALPAGEWTLYVLSTDGQSWTATATTTAGYETLVSLE